MAVAKEGEPFFWGVANAAAQVEGEPAPSDWTEWSAIPGKIDDGKTPADAFGFYRKYEREFDTAKALGANAFRMSIAWERVETAPGKFDETALAHYEKMVVAMRERGLEPVITLHHFVHPAWLKDGVLNSEFPARFAEFSIQVVRRLAKAPASVKWWITINEPEILAVAGYLDGQFPPGRKGDMRGASEAIAALIRAHLAVVNRVRMELPALDLRFGISKHWRPFEAKRFSPFDWIAARFSENFFNRQIMRGVIDGKISIFAPGGKRIRGRVGIVGDRPGIDFVGVNYYGRTVVNFKFGPPFVEVSEGPGTKSDLGWEVYPDGLYRTLMQLDRYGFPIMITENGLADADDTRRGTAIREHIGAIERARREGVKVIGYLHWTMTDNFEWARGYWPKFGLCAANDEPDEKRCRPSFFVYRDLIRERRW